MMSIDRKIDDTAILFLLVQNRQQTHDLTLIGSGANEIAYKWCLWSDWSLKDTVVNWLYKRFSPSGCKDKGIRKF